MTLTPAGATPAGRPPAAQETVPAGPDGDRKTAGFAVTLDNFSGPFDLLLGLISKHEMDITEVALSRVTDEFISYIRGLQADGDDKALDEASEFLVIAATLLDLKAARLLPTGEVEDDEDIALLEARDLLFARLLQYKAFKEIAALLGQRLAREADRFPRQVSLEPHFAALLPELVWRTPLAEFAALAAKALEPKEPAPTQVGLSHLHAPPVSVKEQAAILGARLQAGGPLSFRSLTADADGTLVVVARFLALLEMFRDAVIAFDQTAPLGELTVRWTGPDAEWTGENLSEEYEDTPVPETAADGTEETHD
ncbi:ScpA family protein [Arthrobacter sp. NPDC089319]|uniref:segregation and condensation protein A n=1 Tax=Arthrobacter sp. NPDC089319 TaxID=3155915 RepID=UPI003423BF41